MALHGVFGVFLTGLFRIAPPDRDRLAHLILLTDGQTAMRNEAGALGRKW